MLTLLLALALDTQALAKDDAPVAAAQDARFTDVYENKDGRWVQIAWQNTRIPETPASPR
jgi:hypothetical protein